MRQSPGASKIAEEAEEVIEIADIFSLPPGPGDTNAEKKPADEPAPAAEPKPEQSLIDSQVNKLLSGK